MHRPTIDQLIQAVWQRKAAFLVVFFLVFALTYGLFVAVDFLPEPPTEAATTTPAALDVEPSEEESDDARDPLRLEAETEALAPMAAALPEVIIFDRLDREVPVNNPQSRTIADLDAALLSGAVRHPDSATFTNEGNIFILGHSSYLPNVLNKNFQAFNGIQTLEWGDTIRLRSQDAEYVYRVERVYQAKASEVTVPIAGTGPRLTLATCNSFASKDDRYVVEAELVETRTL